MHDIEKLYRKAQHAYQKLMSTSRNVKSKQYRKLRYQYARLMVCVSRQIRSIPFSSGFQRSLSKELRKVVDQLRPVEQQIARLQRKLEQPAMAESSAAAPVRRELKALSNEIQQLEDHSGATATELRRTLQIVERGEIGNRIGKEAAD